MIPRRWRTGRSVDSTGGPDGYVPDIANLPFDNSYARLGAPFGVPVEPTPLREPHAVAWNPDAAALLDIAPAIPADQRWVRYFSGNESLPGAEPVAMLYAGHQFGGWVPQLGDGRAILLGQVRAPGDRWDLHLKGAGATPFSRGFDGRAVLRSTIREYLCSEAMHGLGIPTTRALCIVGSREPVRRERIEFAATLVRLAPSHVRFGSFQVLAQRGLHDELRVLADHVITDNFPEIDAGPERYLNFLEQVTLRTARMIAHWQAVGWVHGVLNTDNMSVLGLTIDYGPFGFIDSFDPGFVPNLTDRGGRYAWDQQPGIGLWNLTRLGEALLPLIERDAVIATLESYEPAFIDCQTALFQAKLGLREWRDDDGQLLDDLFGMLAMSRADYTAFWRALARFSHEEPGASTPLRDMFVDGDAWNAWSLRYAARLHAEGSRSDDRRQRMDAVNPKYVLRHYLAERAIRCAEDDGDYSEIERLRVLLRNPFAEQPDMQTYADPPPPCSAHSGLSCSS
jgi:serine/tyrosine/threonine adenylyltransferase